jgi:oligoendopeptidase F
MRGDKKDPVLEKEHELQSLMSDNNPEVRKQAKNDWHKFLEEHPERQAKMPPK